MPGVNRMQLGIGVNSVRLPIGRVQGGVYGFNGLYNNGFNATRSVSERLMQARNKHLNQYFQSVYYKSEGHPPDNFRVSKRSVYIALDDLDEVARAN